MISKKKVHKYKMMRNCHKTWLLLLLLAFCLPALAQQPGGGKKSDLDQTYEFINPLRATFSNINKMDVPPQEERDDTEEIEVDYTVEAKPMEVSTPMPQIQPERVRSGSIDRLYHSYVKGGFGNYGSIYGEIFYNTLRSKENLFAAHLKHYSGRGPVEHSNFREDGLTLYGKKNFSKTVLSGKMFYANDQYHFYGYEHDSFDFARPDIRQRFNDVGFEMDFGNLKADSGKFRYDLGSNGYYFTEHYGSREANFTAHAGISEYFKANQLFIGGEVDLNSVRYENPYSRMIIRANSFYRINRPGLNVQAGFKIASERDSTEGDFHFYPDIKIEANLAEDFLIAFGGITGDLQKNSLREFANENPFIVSEPRLVNTNNAFELFAGLKGSLNNDFSFYSRISYRNIENMNYYLNDNTDSAGNRFAIVYDSTNTNLLNIHVEALYNVVKRLNIGLAVDVNKFGSTFRHPWHRPTFTTTLTGRYSLEDKIIFTVDGYFWNTRYATTLDIDNEAITELPGFFDLNAGITYRFNETFSAFIDFKNVLSKQYQIYNNYHVRGFNILGGATVSF